MSRQLPHDIVLSGMWGDVHQASWYCQRCHGHWKDQAYKWEDCISEEKQEGRDE